MPVLFYDQGLKVQIICDLLGVKKTMVYMTLRNYCSHGQAINPNAQHTGRPRSLSAVDLTFIRTFLVHDHTLYLNELQQALETQCGIYVSIPTLAHTLRRRKSVIGQGDVDRGGAKYASTHTRNVNMSATSIKALLINVANVAFRNKQDSA